MICPQDYSPSPYVPKPPAAAAGMPWLLTVFVTFVVLDAVFVGILSFVIKLMGAPDSG